MLKKSYFFRKFNCPKPGSKAIFHGMGKWEKILFDVLRGTGDANIPFSDLCNLLDRLGFERRTRGSHTVFRRAGIEDRINLQKDGNKAKPYQVRQVRDVIVKYRLGDEING